jgi:hypothetical protein
MTKKNKSDRRRRRVVICKKKKTTNKHIRCKSRKLCKLANSQSRPMDPHPMPREQWGGGTNGEMKRRLASHIRERKVRRVCTRMHGRG